MRTFNSFGSLGGAERADSPGFMLHQPQSQSQSQYQQSGPGLQHRPQQNIFNPADYKPVNNSSSSNAKNNMDFDDYIEPPLLVELGINFSHIYSKTLAVFHPRRSLDEEILYDSDLAGPLVFCWIQGVCLLFSGKLHFGYLFGFGLFGCFSIYMILNLMAKPRPVQNVHGMSGMGPAIGTASIESYRVVSILGYGLLPIVLLSALTIVVNLSKGPIGSLVTFMAIFWSTFTGTRFFEKALDMRQQRYLIAYPVFLFYASFGLITVF